MPEFVTAQKIEVNKGYGSNPNTLSPVEFTLLSDEITEADRTGNNVYTLGVILLVRSRTGLGLAAAKDLVTKTLVKAGVK